MSFIVRRETGGLECLGSDQWYTDKCLRTGRALIYTFASFCGVSTLPGGRFQPTNMRSLPIVGLGRKVSTHHSVIFPSLQLEGVTTQNKKKEAEWKIARGTEEQVLDAIRGRHARCKGGTLLWEPAVKSPRPTSADTAGCI